MHFSQGFDCAHRADGDGGGGVEAGTDDNNKDVSLQVWYASDGDSFP